MKDLNWVTLLTLLSLFLIELTILFNSRCKPTISWQRGSLNIDGCFKIISVNSFGTINKGCNTESIKQLFPVQVSDPLHLLSLLVEGLGIADCQYHL